VIDGALTLADSVGLQALTIRALAKHVGAPPMSLYSHFANKEELLDLMYGEVARRLYLDSGHPRWQDELRAVSEQVRQVLLAHPRWVPLLSRPTQPTTVGVRERLLTLMSADGMTPGDALRALTSVTLLALGMALVELSFRDPEGESAFSSRFERIRAHFDETEVSSDTLVSREAFMKVQRFDLGETYRFALGSLIAGLEASTKAVPKP
jgi:AcrR family transcriptional regulator